MPFRFRAFLFTLFSLVAVVALASEGQPIDWKIVVSVGILGMMINNFD
ncbi:hypothetical protein [Nonomuraea dietziae]